MRNKIILLRNVKVMEISSPMKLPLLLRKISAGYANKIRRPIVLSALLAAVFVFFGLCVASAQDISSQELINHALEYDGKEVSYTGELIGAVLDRGPFFWLNLNDGKNAIGVWVDRDLAPFVHIAGSYTHNGDIVTVKGIFYRSCIEHGGGLDIHALELKLVAKGHTRVYRIERYKIVIVLILLGVLACLLITRILLKNFRKR